MLRTSLLFITVLLLGCDSGSTQKNPVSEPIAVQRQVPDASKNLPSDNIIHSAVKANDKFLIGRWRSEAYELYGRSIEENIEFTPTQKKSGKSNFSFDVTYSVKGDVITVTGPKSEQAYKALDSDTVSYEKENIATIILHRIAPPENTITPKDYSTTPSTAPEVDVSAS